MGDKAFLTRSRNSGEDGEMKITITYRQTEGGSMKPREILSQVVADDDTFNIAIYKRPNGKSLIDQALFGVMS